MKRFDFASDVAKQLITISSALITVLIGFYEKFFSQSGTTFTLVVIILSIFVASVICGILTIGCLTNLVNKQEFHDAQAAAAASKTNSAPRPQIQSPESDTDAAQGATTSSPAEPAAKPSPKELGWTGVGGVWVRTLALLFTVTIPPVPPAPPVPPSERAAVGAAEKRLCVLAAPPLPPPPPMLCAKIA